MNIPLSSSYLSTFRRPHSATPVDALRADGYAIFDNLLPSSRVDGLSDELEPWFSATARCRGDFYGWRTTRLGSLLLKSEVARELALHPLMLSIMDAILGPNCDWYQLNLTQAVRVHPQERQQVPHRDDEMWPCTKNGIEYAVNVMWALSDFTRENGATLLWRGSHCAPPTRPVQHEQATVAEMTRGSALVYLGSITHCAGANLTQQPRTGVIISYSLGWLKQHENAFLSYPPHIAGTFPKALRDLLGYRIHRPNLGGYEGQDPSVLFNTDSHTLPAIDSLPEEVSKQLTQYYHGNTHALEGLR
jgi:ectoine hydroxylase-related dioxygenase (phytanoyl-CoA dioxygenase family)